MLQKDLDYIVGVLVRLGQDDAAKKLLKDVRVTQETFSFPPYKTFPTPTYPNLPYTTPLSPNIGTGPHWVSNPNISGHATLSKAALALRGKQCF